MNRWVLLRSRQNFSLYSGGAVCVCDASKGCSKLVIYVQLNYFKLDLIIRSFLRRSRFHRVVGWIAWTLYSQIAWIESKEWVSEFSPMMRLMMCNLRVLKFDFSLFWTPHAREWIFNLTRKWKTVSASSEEKEWFKNEVVKLRIESGWNVVDYQFFNMDTYMPHSRIFQFSYF